MTNINKKSAKEILKTAWRAFYSMRMGIVLLVLVCIFCLIGSIVIQGNDPSYYIKEYGESFGSFIMAIGADNIYNTGLFLVTSALLGMNLLLCSIMRLPILLRRYRKDYKLDKRLSKWDASFTGDFDQKTADAIFTGMGCKITQTEEYDGNQYRYGIKGRINLFGSWLTHLGILLIMAGVAAGSMLLYNDYIIGVKGVSSEVPGTDYIVSIEDYQITYKDNYVVDNYTTTVRVSDKQNTFLTDELTIQVNSPVTVHGYSYLQNSTGWAVEAVIRDLDTKEEVKRQIVYPGGSITDVQGVYTYRVAEVYPDFYMQDNKPSTASPFPNNPVISFAIYYHGGLYSTAMRAAGVDIETDAYTITFENPQLFTVLQITRDPAIFMVAAGSAVLMLGLILAFYLTTLEIWSCDLPDGRQRVFIKYKHGSTLIKDKIDRIIKENEHEQ